MRVILVENLVKLGNRLSQGRRTGSLKVKHTFSCLDIDWMTLKNWPGPKRSIVLTKIFPNFAKPSIQTAGPNIFNTMKNCRFEKSKQNKQPTKREVCVNVKHTRYRCWFQYNWTSPLDAPLCKSFMKLNEVLKVPGKSKYQVGVKCQSVFYDTLRSGGGGENPPNWPAEQFPLKFNLFQWKIQ